MCSSDLSSGRVFFGALDGKVYAVTDGSQQWTYNMNSPPGGAIRYQNGTVYVAAYNGNVYALSPDSGGVQWQATVNDFISASPAVGPDNTVYIGSQDGKLYAIQNGGTKFTVPTGGEVWSCPAISPDHSVYFGSNDGWIYAVYDDGSQKWVEEIEG